MSNLLPEKSHQKIHSEYRARFLLAGASLAIGAAVFAALALLPSFGVLIMSRPGALARANQAQQDKQDGADISQTKSLMTALAPVAAASSSATTALIDALSEKPAGVHIDNAVYNAPTQGSQSTIAIGGVADNRASMDKYRTTLQSDPLFSSVKLPVGDLLGSQGGRFTVTLTGNF